MSKRHVLLSMDSITYRYRFLVCHHFCNKRSIEFFTRGKKEDSLPQIYKLPQKINTTQLMAVSEYRLYLAMTQVP